MIAPVVLTAPALAAGTVTPSVDCAVNNGDGTYTAYFGYLNTTASSVSYAIGDSNEFIPGAQFQGQPMTFNMGSYPEVVSVTFDPAVSPTVTWILNGTAVSASASTAPCLAASTGLASEVSQTTATLSALIDPRGESTTYHFDYGTTTLYGQSTLTQSLTGDDPSLQSATLNGLVPGTTYHYRVQATNATVGTTLGQDETFTTPPAPGTPPPAALSVTEPASDLTITSASLNGVVNPQNQPISYQFQWGTTTAYGHITPPASASGGDPQSVTSALTGLSPATTYHYRLIASQRGLSTDGADQTFTTPALAAPTPARDADLVLTLRRAPKTGLRGRPLTYAFEIANRGPVTASSVTFSDLLTPGLSVIRVSARGGSCSHRHGSSCRFGRLAPGAETMVSITLKAARTGQLREVALVFASQPDPDVVNYFAVVTTRFFAPPHRHPQPRLCARRTCENRAPRWAGKWKHPMVKREFPGFAR